MILGGVLGYHLASHLINIRIHPHKTGEPTIWPHQCLMKISIVCCVAVVAINAPPPRGRVARPFPQIFKISPDPTRPCGGQQPLTATRL